MLAYGSLITLVIVAGIAVLVKWLAQSMAVRHSAESITPEDLKALEDASARMVDEIKETAAVAIRDLDDRCEQLRKLILIADQKVMLWSQIIADQTQPIAESKAPEVFTSPIPERSEDADTAQRIYHLADSGMDPAEIAREAGQPIGEVELLLGLRSAARV